MSKDMTWKGASKYLKAAMATTLIASIGAAYTYDTVEAAVNYNSEVQIEQAFNQHSVLSYNKFVDVRADTEFFNEIQWATEFKIGNSYLMVGFEDGTFGPKNPLTEEQFAAMIQRFYNIESVNDTGTVTDLNSWSDGVYASLAHYGVPLAGYKDKSIRSKPITRGQMAQIVAHVAGQSNNLDNAVKYLFDTGITAGSYPQKTNLLDKYGYKDNLTRGQAAAFFKRLYSKGMTNLKVGNKGSLESGLESGYIAVDSRLVSKTQPKPPVVETKPPASTIQATNPVLKQVAGIYEKHGYSIDIITDDRESFTVEYGNTRNAFVSYNGDNVYGVRSSDMDFKIGAEIVSKLTGENVSDLYEAAKFSSKGKAKQVGKVIVAYKPGGVQFSW